MGRYTLPSAATARPIGASPSVESRASARPAVPKVSSSVPGRPRTRTVTGVESTLPFAVAWIDPTVVPCLAVGGAVNSISLELPVIVIVFAVMPSPKPIAVTVMGSTRFCPRCTEIVTLPVPPWMTDTGPASASRENVSSPGSPVTTEASAPPSSGSLPDGVTASGLPLKLLHPATTTSATNAPPPNLIPRG